MGVDAVSGRSAAVEYFLTQIGVPDEMTAQMRGNPSWVAMEAVAHTLVYDGIISEATSAQLLASVTIPTLILSSDSSGDDLTAMSTIVATAIPNGSHRRIAGEWHGVPDDVLADALNEFFRS